MSINVFRAVTVYPHTRGEFGDPLKDSSPLFGSPPHAWGIPVIFQQFYFCVRFTPTRVGNSGIGLIETFPISVHPHTRGEFKAKKTDLVEVDGSPPHAWGIHYRRYNRNGRRRFTPTRVGNSSFVP